MRMFVPLVPITTMNCISMLTERLPGDQIFFVSFPRLYVHGRRLFFRREFLSLFSLHVTDVSVPWRILSMPEWFSIYFRF